MCGICGIKGLTPELRNNYIGDMLTLLSHRGPDETGLYTSEIISVGVRRLSIIDLKTGSQPIYNEDKSLVVVCNGEIYNFRPLRDILAKKGHNFYTNSDIEVIAHLYEEYGIGCLEHLKGMFSFAIWDKNKKSLFIARDRFGIKPLYYYWKNDLFAFSSELKALLKLPLINKELNIQALDLYFSLEYIPSPHSIFKNVYKLKPAHYIILKDNDMKIYRYWDLEKQNIKNKIPFHDAKDKFKQLFYLSIKEHLISDAPLGVFLSGGIDSSTLVASMKKIYNKQFPTFSIGFKEKSFDESKYAEMVSKHFDTEHHYYTFTIIDFIENFYDVITLLDEPFADLSIFPTSMLAKFSSQYIKVALSGEGADEMFMGYPTYIAHKYINLLNGLPSIAKRSIEYLINLLPTSSAYFSLDFKLKQFIKGGYEKNPILRHILWMGAFSVDEKNMLYSEMFKQNELKNTSAAINDFIKCFKNLNNLNTKGPYKLIQYLDIIGYLSEDILFKSDSASMFSSIEIRVPYLDHELVEFIWNLSHQFIYQKKLLKEAMKGIVPNKILFRSKKGFPIPFSNWFKNKSFFSLVKEFFDKSFIDSQGLFNYNYIDSLYNEHLSGRRDNRKKLRTYIMFQAWYKNWHNQH